MVSPAARRQRWRRAPPECTRRRPSTWLDELPPKQLRKGRLLDVLRGRHGAKQRLYTRGIELRTRKPLQLRERLGCGQRGAVRTRAGHGVKRIRHMDDSRGERNVFGAQTEWIPATVGALVMQLDNRQVRRQKRHLPEDSCTEPGMPLDLLELLRPQPPVLPQNR